MPLTMCGRYGSALVQVTRVPIGTRSTAAWNEQSAIFTVGSVLSVGTDPLTQGPLPGSAGAQRAKKVGRAARPAGIMRAIAHLRCSTSLQRRAAGGSRALSP